MSPCLNGSSFQCSVPASNLQGMWPLPPPALVPVGTVAEAARAHIHLHLIPAPTHVQPRLHPHTCLRVQIRIVMPARARAHTDAWDHTSFLAGENPSVCEHSPAFRSQAAAGGCNTARQQWQPARDGCTGRCEAHRRRPRVYLCGTGPSYASASRSYRPSPLPCLGHQRRPLPFFVFGVLGAPLLEVLERHRRTGSLPCELQLVARPTVAHWHTGG